MNRPNFVSFAIGFIALLSLHIILDFVGPSLYIALGKLFGHSLSVVLSGTEINGPAGPLGYATYLVVGALVGVTARREATIATAIMLSVMTLGIYSVVNLFGLVPHVQSHDIVYYLKLALLGASVIVIASLAVSAWRNNSDRLLRRSL